MGKVAIFIDGGYLNKAGAKEFGKPVIDFNKLSVLLCGDHQVLRTYYYNCMPYKSATPTEEESRRFASMQRFTDSLEKLENFQVKLGKLELKGIDRDGKQIFQQKRVDILLGCDLVLLSAKQRIEKAIIITGDSDFIPAVEIAKNEGVEVELVYAAQSRPHESLFRICDKRRVLTAADMEKIKY